MLVLSRKVKEEIIMPQYGIILTVLEVRGDRVRIGISAPPDVEVHRREVWERMQQNTTAREIPFQEHAPISNSPKTPLITLPGEASHGTEQLLNH